MGSRIRDSADKIFELFVEIARPDNEEKDPFILQKFPDDYADEGTLKSIPQFAFPCSADSIAVDHFTFVLTDEESKFKFGFCRHAAGSHTCLCIISCLPWFEIFYKMLNVLAEIVNNTDHTSLIPLLQAVYKQDVPTPGMLVEAVTPDFKDRFSFFTPDPSMLPSIPENRNLMEYYNAVDVNNMMIIFASMLQERRILITSRKLSRLTACIHGSASLIYPMHWQHLYIPVLPKHLLDYCSAPMPYLIGIHSSLFEKIRLSELGDTIILDADRNTVQTEHDDLAMMPQEITSSLRKHLKMQQSDRMKTSFMGDSVARAFLRALVRLIGGYRDALKFRQGEQITFDPDAFMQSRPPNMQPFLESVLHLQIFEQFITDRLDSLNSGNGFSDEFELEANLWADKLNSNSKYKEWLRIKGKKIRKEGKDKLAELSSKMKDKSKTAVKNLKTKLDEFRKDEEEGGNESYIRSDPTPINGPDLKRERPPRPPAPVLHGSVDNLTNTPERSRNYKLIDVELEAFDDDFRPISINLMEDPDIQQAMKKSLSVEDIPDELKETDESDGSDTNVRPTSIMNYQSGKPGLRTSDALLDKPVPPPRSKKRSTSVTSPGAGTTSPAKTTSTSTTAAPPTTGTSSVNSEDTENADVVKLRSKGSLRRSVHRDQPLINFGMDSDSNPSSLENNNENKSADQSIDGSNGIQYHSRYTNFDPVSADEGHLKKLKVDLLNTCDVQNNLYQMYPRHTEFDPLEADRDFDNEMNSSCNYLSQSVPSNSDSFMKFANSAAERCSPVLGGPPRPLPRSNSRNSVKRQEAFYNVKKPLTLQRSGPQQQAADNNTIRDARTAFLQNDSPRRPASVAIDSFDPLVSGQLAVDSPSRAFLSGSADTISDNASSSSGGGNDSHEDDLLKEWNLDFSKMRITAGSRPNQPPPPVPPKPNLPQGMPFMQSRHSMYVTGSQGPSMQPQMAHMQVGYQNMPSRTLYSSPMQVPVGTMFQPTAGTPFSQTLQPAVHSMPFQQSPHPSPHKPVSMVTPMQTRAPSPPVRRVSPIPPITGRTFPPPVPKPPNQADVLKARNVQNVQLVDLSVTEKPATKSRWETFD